MRKYLSIIILLLLLSTPVLAATVFKINQLVDTSTPGIVWSNGIGTSTLTTVATSSLHIDAADLTYYRDSYSSRFSAQVTVSTVAAALDNIFAFTYVAPAITLSSVPSATTKEFGDPINSVALSALTVKKSNPITSVSFYRGASEIKRVSSPNAGGGTETYTETTPVTTTTSFNAKVGDGTSTTTSNTVTFTYVYPIYG